MFQKDKPDCNYYKQATDGNTYDVAVFADIISDKAPENIKNALVEKLRDTVPEFPFVKYFDGVWSPHESTQPVVGMCSCFFTLLHSLGRANVVPQTGKMRGA